MIEPFTAGAGLVWADCRLFCPLKGGAKVCQRQLVNEVLGFHLTEFAVNLARERATLLQRAFHGGLLLNTVDPQSVIERPHRVGTLAITTSESAFRIMSPSQTAARVDTFMIAVFPQTGQRSSPRSLRRRSRSGRPCPGICGPLPWQRHHLRRHSTSWPRTCTHAPMGSLT
jgi:hypothetical protein